LTTTAGNVKYLKDLSDAYKEKIMEKGIHPDSPHFKEITIPEEILKMKQNGMLESERVGMNMKFFEPFTIFELPGEYVALNDKKVKAHIFLIKFKTWKKSPKVKSKKKTKAMRLAKKFVLNHTNRFRYYKTKKGYGIVGVYKGYILGIIGKQKPTPKDLKDSLESFRVNYFFGG
jgi:hypothetical protein